MRSIRQQQILASVKVGTLCHGLGVQWWRGAQTHSLISGTYVLASETDKPDQPSDGARYKKTMKEGVSHWGACGGKIRC